MSGEWESDAWSSLGTQAGLWDSSIYDLVPFNYAIDINPNVKLSRGELYAFVDMAQIDPNRSLVHSTVRREFKGGGSRFKDGDTLFARITPCLENGKIARYVSMVPDQIAHGSTEFIVMRGREGISDNNYVFYLVRSASFRSYAISRMNGSSGRQRVATDAFSGLEIPLPPLPEQRRITKILGDLDDKIELNRRMNETLEQMARALFKSWFVDFDPVRAKMEGRIPSGMDAATAALFPDRLVDSELGPIPEGWEVKALGDCVTLLSGGTPKTAVEEYWNGDIPWFSVKDVPSEGDVWVTTTEKSITQQGLRNSATQILPHGTTIVTARGTVGKLALVGTPMAMNQSCYGVRSKNGIRHYFTYFLMREAVVKLQQNTHGSVFETITRQTFDSLSCVMPSEAILEKFESAVEPYLESIRINIHQSRALSTLRDTLLPKLVSGQVRVESLYERQLNI